MKEKFNFLDSLETTGYPMFASAPKVAEAFGISHRDARLVLSAWTKTWSTSPAGPQYLTAELE